MLLPKWQNYIGGEELGSHVMHGYITTVTDKQVTSQQNWLPHECKYVWIALRALLKTSIQEKEGNYVLNIQLPYTDTDYLGYRYWKRVKLLATLCTCSHIQSTEELAGT